MQLAWFDSDHPGVRVECSTCGVAAGKPCVATQSLLAVGDAVAGGKLTGLHAARVAAGAAWFSADVEKGRA